VSVDGQIRSDIARKALPWWLLPHDHIHADLATMSTLLDGRRTHELMLEAWPHAEDHPDRPGQDFRPASRIARLEGFDTADRNSGRRDSAYRRDGPDCTTSAQP
jgi:hypothetical protein